MVYVNLRPDVYDKRIVDKERLEDEKKLEAVEINIYA
jgi:hypothetical protein